MNQGSARRPVAIPAKARQREIDSENQMRGKLRNMVPAITPIALCGKTPTNARLAYSPATKRLATFDRIAESGMEAHHFYFFGGFLSSPVFSQQTFPVRSVALTTNGMTSF